MIFEERKAIDPQPRVRVRRVLQQLNPTIWAVTVLDNAVRPQPEEVKADRDWQQVETVRTIEEERE